MGQQEILVLIANAQKLPLNAKADIPKGARGLNFGLSPDLYQFFVYVSSKGSGESAGQPEPSMLNNVISTKILIACSNSDIFVVGSFQNKKAC